ncbi:hypothetical protein BJV77DRAFT_1068787 [Russula vinacea]|nr:hypothetical protein BJV77DRAFT_1068787 [Russula vinacea]
MRFNVFPGLQSSGPDHLSLSYSMESLSCLWSALLGVLEAQNATDEQDLFNLLVLHRHALVSVFDTKPPSEDKRKELRSGICTVHGQQLSVNDDFATQVIYIAWVLDCSERHIAGLMQHVISNNPNLTPVYILEEVASEISPITALHARLQHFVKTQVIPSEGADSILFGEKGLGWTVLLKIEAIDKTLSQVLAVKQNAGGNMPEIQYSLHACRIADPRAACSCHNSLPHHSSGILVPPRHPISYYVLRSLLAAFVLVDPQTPGGELRQHLTTFPSTLNLMKRKLDLTEEWKEAGVRATLQLKWTLFLMDARHHDPSLEHKDRFRTEELEMNIWNAVQGNAFTSLAGSVAKLHRREVSTYKYHRLIGAREQIFPGQARGEQESTDTVMGLGTSERWV